MRNQHNKNIEPFKDQESLYRVSICSCLIVIGLVIKYVVGGYIDINEHTQPIIYIAEGIIIFTSISLVFNLYAVLRRNQK